MSQRRPHTRTFAGLVLLLFVLVAIGARLLVPAQSDAHDQSSAIGLTTATSETVDGVMHPVDHITGLPADRTVAAQLTTAGVTVAPEDRVSAFPNPILGLGSQLTIERAAVVSVTDWGKVTTYRTWVPTVGALLTERAIDLGAADTINIDRNTAIVDKMNITITRVEETNVTETEPIPFTASTVNDPSMEKGQTRLVQAGKNGLRTKTYHVRRENGVEVTRVLTDSTVTTQPVTQQTAIGTHVTLFGVGTATWYGLLHGFGAASNTIPYGTKVHVVNTANGKSVDVTINDHGIQGSAIIDLDAEAFQQIAPLGQGVASVRLEKSYGN